MTNHNRRLIEDSLPLEAISYQSAREKSIRHGHISTLHIWWARRPLAAMRAAIFAALMPAPKDEAEREEMHRLIGGTYNAQTGKWEGGICDWNSVNNGNDESVIRARELIAQHYAEPPKILDPFMGGGSTGLEALRLGAEAYGVELNPVAHIIEMCTLVYPQKYGQLMDRSEYEARPGTLPPLDIEDYLSEDDEESLDEETSDSNANESADTNSVTIDDWADVFSDVDEMVNPLAEDVERWGYWVLEETRKEIGELYVDKVNDRTVVGYVWARTATCPNPSCRSEMPIAKQWWLAKRKGKRIAVRTVPSMKDKKVHFEIAENDDIDFDPSDGTVQRGGIKCLVCGQSPNTDYLKDEGMKGNLSAVPFAVITNDPTRKGKAYRAPTDTDFEQFEKAKSILEKRLQDQADAIPTEKIPDHSTRAIFVHLYGLTEWGDLYNDRQALALRTLIDKAHKAFEIIATKYDADYARAVITYIALVVDSIADRNCTLCTWRGGAEDVGHVFGRQTLSMAWDYVETNPMSGSTGSWQSAIDKTVRVVRNAALAGTIPAKLYNGTSTRLPVDELSIQAVITDPPYYDAVPYADLSDFFYVWMRRALQDFYPNIFMTPLTPKGAEIIQEPGRHADNDTAKEFYENEMTKAFSEAQRVLEAQGIFTVVFAHKSTAAWETLVNSLLQSGLIITASWPLHTESPGRLRAMNSAALASSIFIVCRKRVAVTEGIYDDVRPRIKERIRERLDFFWSQGIRGADFFISAIGPAVEIFGQYKTVRKLSGDVVTVAELLDIVQQEVADYALSQVMNGGAAFGPFDPQTRFYIMYRWSYGGNKVEFDDGMRLAMALGAEVDDLMRNNGVLKKSGSNVQLLSPFDRDDNDRLGELRDRIQPPLIDMVHRAALLWRSGERETLARFVSDVVGTRTESMRAVAQALINVLPDGDKEKQLYEGFLQGELPTAPRSQQMFDDKDFK